MLHLNPGVHFEEKEVAVRGEQEFARPGTAISDRNACRHRGGTHAFAQRVIDRDRRRLFDQLLVPSLDRALALANVNRSLVIGEDLNLDVTWALDVLLEVHAAIPEGLGGFARCGGERGRKLARGGDDAHPLATAACRCLDEHRVADLAGDRRGLVRVTQCRQRTWHDRHAGGGHQAARRRLVAHRRDRRRRRPDEDQPGVFDRLGEGGALGEESVARVYRIGAARSRRSQQYRDTQVALGGRGRSDPDRSIGNPDKRRVPVGVGVDRDGLESLVPAGAHDAQCDLAAVRDENPAQRPGIHCEQAGMAGGVRSSELAKRVRHRPRLRRAARS